MSRFVVYTLVDPRTLEIRYVGKSTRGAKSRLSMHCAPSHLKAKTHKAAWIRELVAEGVIPTIQVIQETQDPVTLLEAERFWIRTLRDQGCRLTNLTDGGDGICGYSHTEETKKKIALAASRQVWSPERCKASSLALRGVKKKPRTSNHAIALSRSLGCLPFEDEFGTVYQTQKEAERILKLSSGSVSRVLSGKFPSALGHTFKYLPQQSLT